MATITVVPKKVRLANTHNVLSRARPLNGTAQVGQVAMMNGSGQWEKADGSAPALGVFISFTDGRIDGLAGDDAEVLMEGIIAGYDVDPGELVYDAADSTVGDTGTQALGVGLNDGLLYIRPTL